VSRQRLREMEKQAELLGIPSEPNPLRARFGPGPEGAKCKTCVHLIDLRGGAKLFHKCFRRGASNSEATDHRVGWNACSLYEVKP
jgi:hypothetical protein